MGTTKYFDGLDRQVGVTINKKVYLFPVEQVGGVPQIRKDIKYLTINQGEPDEFTVNNSEWVEADQREALRQEAIEAIHLKTKELCDAATATHNSKQFATDFASLLDYTMLAVMVSLGIEDPSQRKLTVSQKNNRHQFADNAEWVNFLTSIRNVVAPIRDEGADLSVDAINAADVDELKTILATNEARA